MKSKESLARKRDAALLWAAEARMRYLSFDSATMLLRRDRPNIQRQQRVIAATFSGLREGEKGREGMNGAELVDAGLLGNRTLEIRGAENIPNGKPLLIVANHDVNRFATLYSVGQIATVNFAIELARQGGGKHLRPDRDKERNHPHWLQAATARNRIGSRITYVINHRIAHSFDHILVDREWQKENLESILEARKVWRNKGVVGLMPEADAGARLRKVDPRAEKLLKLVARMPEKDRPVVLAVAALVGGTKAFVRVSHPLELDRNAPGEQVMLAIASMLPASKRGAYARYF